MTPRPFKLCPRCQKPAAIDVTTCANCGRRYRTPFKQNDYASSQRTTNAGNAPHRTSSRQTVSGAPGIWKSVMDAFANSARLLLSGSPGTRGFLALFVACAIIFPVLGLKALKSASESSVPETLEWVPAPAPATINFEREHYLLADSGLMYDIYALRRLKAQDEPDWVKVGSVGDGGTTELKCMPIRDSSSASPCASYKVSLSIRAGSKTILSPPEFTAYPGSVTKVVLTKNFWTPDHLEVSTEDEGSGGTEVQLITMNTLLKKVVTKVTPPIPVSFDGIVRYQDTITTLHIVDVSSGWKFSADAGGTIGATILPFWGKIQVGIRAEIEKTIHHHYEEKTERTYFREVKGVNRPYIARWIQYNRTGKARVKNPDGTVVDIPFELPDSSDIELVAVK